MKVNISRASRGSCLSMRKRNHVIEKEKKRKGG
jgi:hypothetical protein